ncbi:ABC transporter permease subunit, partial [Paraburkholderia tropica]|uniref:ABC transporter permease subunit n=1 Tax=Paraburkholderia tropica TaxID=92647 RepID=UPI002AB0B2AB
MDYIFHWNVFLQRASEGVTYLDWIISGFEVTVTLGLLSWVIALVLGSFLGVIRTSNNKWAAGFGGAYVELFRNIPLIMQLFLWYFVAPEILPGGDRFKQMNPVDQEFISAVVCLSTYTAARICEQVRSGIGALPRGQRNAGLALGMTAL